MRPGAWSACRLDALELTNFGTGEGSAGVTGVSGELSFAAAVRILVAGEKAAIDDRTGHGASVDEGRAVRVAVCLWVSSDEDIRNAVR